MSLPALSAPFTVRPARRADFAAIAELAGPGEAVLGMLVVDPAWRGAGVGTAPVQECLRRARRSGQRAMVICTEPQMHVTHRRLGFRRVPERDWSPAPGTQLLADSRAL
ncbi:MAG: GNAT family N-acetyltransferase [Actinomycetota bacterium]|nr:GNAT family N-acetyltransferase [Actinomycetota bacterium]